ncbi:MAG: hypothetical protein QW478_04170 [Candidatus Micrarchaeaceae archaeon]
MRRDRWIQKAIRHKGRTHRYLERLYGEKAFTKEGKIKTSYLDKAIKHARREGETSLERALILAKRLKRMRK